MDSNVKFFENSEPLFQQFDKEYLESTDNSILGINDSLHIVMHNPGYEKFAIENKGETILEKFPLGSNILDAISGPQKSFYSNFFINCFKQNKHTEHEYECSSQQIFRLLKLFVYPTQDKRALLLEHTIIETSENESVFLKINLDDYLDANKVMIQCGQCRRAQHRTTKQWDWVESSLSYKNVSHGLCESCLATYYPEIK